MNEKKLATAKKTLYEIAYLNEDGILIRGGVKATIATVGKWIEESLEIDPDTIYVAVPADEDAITCAELRKMMMVEAAETQPKLT